MLHDKKMRGGNSALRLLVSLAPFRRIMAVNKPALKMLYEFQHIDLTKMAPYAIPILLVYPLLVSLLRFRRVQHLHEKYRKYTTGASTLGDMTDDEAFDIQKNLMELEFPFMYIKALQFALFRVCPLCQPFKPTGLI